MTLAAVAALAAWARIDEPDAVYAAFIFLEYALVLALLSAGAVVDVRERVIPNAVPAGIVLVHVLLCLLAVALGSGDAMRLAARSALGLLVLGGGLLAFTMAYERLVCLDAFGGGDIKLMGALGFAFGWQQGVAVLAIACIAFCLGLGAGSLRSRARGGPPRQDGPFAPAIAFATFMFLALK